MHTYADLGWRTPFVVVAVSTNAVLGLVTSTLGMLFDEASPDLTLAALILPAFFGSLASFLVAIVAVCLWTYRACANAHALVGDWVAPSVSPAFAVGSYFIPFVNLVRPYQAMREIDSASLGAASTDSMVGLWWGTWIAGNILGNIGFRFESPTADLISSVVAPRERGPARARGPSHPRGAALTPRGAATRGRARHRFVPRRTHGRRRARRA